MRIQRKWNWGLKGILISIGWWNLHLKDFVVIFLTLAIFSSPRTFSLDQPIPKSLESLQTEMVAQDSVYLTWVQNALEEGTAFRDRFRQENSLKSRKLMINNERITKLQQWIKRSSSYTGLSQSAVTRWKAELRNLLVENSALYALLAASQFRLFLKVQTLNRKLFDRFLAENQRHSRQLGQLDRLNFALEIQSQSRRPSWHDTPFIERFRLVGVPGLF